MQIISRITHVLATGFILMFFSESLFWAQAKLEDTIAGWLMTWGVYSLLAYVFLAMLAKFKVTALTGIFLCGAVFGWMAEGLIVQTMYEDLPLSISFTGLGWHALISVCIGWYAVRKALHTSNAKIALISSLIGISYGLWAISWWTEPGVGKQAPLEFLVYSLIITILVIAAYWLVDRTADVRMKPGKIMYLISAALFLLLFVLRVIPVAGFPAIILPSLLLIVVLALKTKTRSNEGVVPNVNTDRCLSAGRILWLLLIPALSAIIYSVFFILDLEIQTNWGLYLIVTPLGFGIFLYSLYDHFFRKQMVKTEESSS